MALQTTSGAESLAWAVGLFEGEGCIHLGDGRRGPRLDLKMTDRDVVERFAAWSEVGKVRRKRPDAFKPHYKTQWTWDAAHRDEVRRLLVVMLPWFGERRKAKALEALAQLDEIEKRRDRVCWCGKPFRVERKTKCAGGRAK